jgi:hypothetical protein
MKSRSLLAAAVWAVIFLTLTAKAVPPTPDLIQKDLAQVPPSDPAVTNVPEIVAAMKGVHPRLLFTAAEIAALKARIPTDPVLQKAYDGTTQWAKMSFVPTGPNPIIVQDDQSALVKAFSQAPALAYSYALDKDPAIKQKIVATLTDMLNAPFWGNNNELDNSMGTACNMFLVALLYDTVYNELDPDLRGKLAQKIFTHARRMYYLGHKQLAVNYVKYWQFDPQPNHRWYRDMGLAACVLAVADEPGIDSGYMLQSLKDEMDFVMKWYPPDGDCHEGAGYQNFGYTPIVSACEMMDRVLGTTYLQDSGLKNAWWQQIYYWVPGRLSDISWGDDQNGLAAFYSQNDDTFFLGPHLSRDQDAQAALLMRLDKTVAYLAAKGKPTVMPWTMLAYYDPTVGQGDYHNLALYKLFPDIGAASMRDSWADDAVVFTFKCGPYGGYKLNAYRNSTLDAQGNPHAVNVAHDDPDANEFALAVGNGFAFHPGVYTESSDPKVVKLTQEHSTITVDGKGQVGEGYGFTQPVGHYDMTQLSYLTGWKTDDKGHIIVEGEAGNAYRDCTGPELKVKQTLPDPVLKTYRRTAIWLPKEYILILDNIQANGPHTIVWRGTAPQSQVANGQGIATTETGTPVAFQTVSDHTFDSKSVPMTLFGRFGNVPVQQIQYTLSTDAVKFATVLDPWKTNPQVKISSNGGATTVTVHTAGFDDTWTWNDPKDATTPSSIGGSRGGAPLISLTDADKAPKE